MKNKKLKAFFGYLFVLFAAMASLSATAQAATYIVSNTDNAGAGSLRAAIDAANSTPDDDTINFNIPGCENGGCTINGAVFSINASGKLTIANKPNVINIVLNANGGDRIFVVQSGANLTLSGITVAGGNSDNTDDRNAGGGGIYNKIGGNLTLNNSTVTDNRTDISNGGGISSRGTTTMTNSLIQGNHAGSGGGGVSSEGIITITNCRFVGNDGAASSGGGLYVISEKATILNSTFSNNNAFSGGAIALQGSSITLTELFVTGSTLRDNTAPNGGGFDNAQGTAIIKDSIVDGNGYTGTDTSSDGGGISNSGGTVTLLNTTVSGNRTGRFGGGIYNSSEMFVINSSIVRNAANELGGGIFNGSLATLRNSIFAENSSTSNPDVANFNNTISKGNNLIGNSTGDNPVKWEPTDILDQSPRLGPLGNYGGPTLTFPLTNNSPAINAGNSCVVTLNGCGDGNPALAFDQRGAARVDAVDIGAFERNNPITGGQFRATTTEGTTNRPYSHPITTDSGAFSYMVTGGSLPPGLTLTNTALSPVRRSLVPTAGGYSITGTPIMSGTFNYTITATDGANTFVVNYSTTIVALPPTAANVEIGGRVTAMGRGLANAQIALSDQNGNTRIAITNAFGYFSFGDVTAGASYFVSISAKRYRFEPRLISVNDNLTDLEFSAQ